LNLLLSSPVDTPIMASAHATLDDLEQQVREVFARDGAAVLYATVESYRQIRRLRNRLAENPPERGWDLELRKFDAKSEAGAGVLVARLPGESYPFV